MAALIAWSGLSADMFVKDAHATPGPSSLSVISTSLKSDPHLTPEASRSPRRVDEGNLRADAEEGLACHTQGFRVGSKPLCLSLSE